MTRAFSLGFVVSVVVTFNAFAATLYVSLESTNPEAPYATWASAATNIQDAVDAAKDGDTVLVTNGVYAVGMRDTPDSSTNSLGMSRVVVTNAITLQSVNGPLVTTIVGAQFTDEHGFATNGVRCVCLGPEAVLSGFTLTNGYTRNSGGGVMGDESGVVTNCILSGNAVDSYNGGGGGAHGVRLYNCVLMGNWVRCRSFGWGGGASRSTLYNCTVIGNSPGSDGAFYSCTLVDNQGGISGTAFNSIVYYNFGGNYAEGTTLNYCCTTPLPTNGVGNITGPPLFMDMTAGDLRLWEGSPCIDAGTNLLGLTFTHPWTDDLAVYAYEPTDILGNTRFIDGNGDGKVAWDIGAYEFYSFKPPRLSGPPQLTAQGWSFTITGATNKWVGLQRTSDFTGWWDLQPPVFVGTDGVCEIIDADREPKAMFYRAVVVP